MTSATLGILLLVFLLGLGLFVSGKMDAMQLPLTETLDQAADAALFGDFSQAVALGEEAKTKWERQWNITASLADHVPMDEIDGLFIQLQAYAKEEEKPHFAACCLELSSLIRAVAEAHQLSWWNLL